MTARLAVAVVLACVATSEARAQLISPGKLSRVHSELEGVRNCTRCHELGVAGVSSDKCLDCHQPLASRLETASGYHATLDGRACTECHKEHFGEDFQIVRFDSAGFEHATIGFTLAGRHDELGCRDCHAAGLVAAQDVLRFKGKASALDRTYLGLGTLCVSCHADEDPHRDQFAQRGCDECHGERDWKEAERFDHDGTRYRLTGRHRRVRCSECHRPLDDTGESGRLQFTGLAYSGCESCHKDVHRGAMGADCSRCHSTGGWQRIADRKAVEQAFDHSTTDFALTGAHATAECDACHATDRQVEGRLRISFDPATVASAYPHPEAEACTSCHVDYHEGVFAETPGGLACDNCHTEDDWTPVIYGIERHDRESRFRLTGSHIPVVCGACHTEVDASGYKTLRFRIADQSCIACHGDDDPHAGQFGARDCTACHDTLSFSIPSFDHSQTRWPLDGAHRDVPCASCHMQETTPGGEVTVRYRPLEQDCKACHREEP